MQFRDLKTQYNVLKDEMDQAILDVVASSAYVMGPKVKEMENAFADYVGVKHCIGCASGTDALLLALKAWDVKAGDAVFVPSFTFFASAEVVAIQGATPVFVDVDPDTFNMDVRDLIHKIEHTAKRGQLNPKAIIAVDLFGLPADFKLNQRRWPNATGFIFSKTPPKALAGVLATAKRAPLAILPPLPSSQPNP
jgi:Predicted pyridoxal phosphate-dependent enzyme apparently involved in regulation of cell wall biogenesis